GHDPEDREEDPVGLLHVGAAEPVGSLHLPDEERDPDANDDEGREEVLQEGEPRGMAEVGQCPGRVDHREHRLGDRRQQDQEPPEDRRVHRAGDRLLEELALAQDLDELPASPGSGTVDPARGTGGADDVEPRPAASDEERDGGRQHHGDGERAQELVRRRISSVRAGITWNTSPTTPRSAIFRIGASASLLIATIRFAPFIPTMCCRAPLIPAAMYTSGFTVLP